MDIDQILLQLTLEEKAGLCSGKDFWHLKGVERLGLPAIMVTDGPHGLRKQEGNSDHVGLNQSVPATCFPAACTTASSWDPALLYEMGAALGEECRTEQVSVLLGPGANIKRSPLCGRNFEYFSEDPYVSGTLAAAFIKGVQSMGVGTSLKHYAANNQEKMRLVNNSVVDQRALREIYLAGFETAVKEAQPWTIMCSYNLVNGTYASEHPQLLTTILKEEWKHEGIVVTDWGATNDRVAGLKAGLELEMPGSGGMRDAQIVQAVQEGTLSPQALDNAVRRILGLLLKAKETLETSYTYDKDAHHQLARKIAARSMVLMKNEGNLLPLNRSSHIAIVGAFAQNPRFQGAGSSLINPTRLANALSALAERGITADYAAGYSLKSDMPDEALLAEAVTTAQGKDCVVVFVGLPDTYESEGFDRTHMQMPESHNRLIEQLAEVNPNLVVVLSGGAPVEMPWAGKAKAILNGYLAGQAGGSAVADLLLGEANPCGKLAESWPAKLEDVPCTPYWHRDDYISEYRESIYVGYRYYDAAGIEPAYPFGHGLSYTTFAYSGLALSKVELAENEGVEVRLRVKNTGAMAGEEIVQVYVKAPGAATFRPEKELRGFAKVALNPGEEKQVCIFLDTRAFQYYNTDTEGWCTEAGAHTILVGASSRDIRAEAVLAIHASTSAGPKLASKAPAYYDLKAPEWRIGIPAAQFEALYGTALPERDKNAPFTINSTIGSIKHTPVGQQLLIQIAQQTQSMMGELDPDSPTAKMFAAIFEEMPLRNLVMFGNGAMTLDTLSGMIAVLNADKTH